MSRILKNNNSLRSKLKFPWKGNARRSRARDVTQKWCGIDTMPAISGLMGIIT